MPNNQLLRNAFPKWFEGKGIFASMTSTPWQDEIDGITLDIEYFGNRSGYKFCAPLVYNFLDEDGAVTENGRQAIARVLLARYSKPWTRLWNLMKSQYDPLDNFSITEEIDMTSHASGQDKSNGTDTDKGTIETDHSGTDTNKSTGTEKTSRTGQNTSKDTSTATGSGSASRSGYNSTSPVTVNGQSAANSSTVNHVEIPNEDNTRTPDLTDERTLALKDKDTRDITIERNNLVERDNTQTDKGTRKRTGVSGLISRQRLVEQEREAWQWDFFESVFSDVDKILALSVYDPCVMSQFDYTGGSTSGGYVLPIATKSALGGVRAPAKTDGSVQVQVDAAGFLYVPPYPESSKIDFASTDKLGGIKLPSEPSGDGGEISTKNGVQFVVDKTLSPGGGYKEDDTVSVVIPYAGAERGGLVKGPAKTNETQQVAVSSDGTMWVANSGGSSIRQIEAVYEDEIWHIPYEITLSVGDIVQITFGKISRFVGIVTDTESGATDPQFTDILTGIFSHPSFRLSFYQIPARVSFGRHLGKYRLAGVGATIIAYENGSVPIPYAKPNAGLGYKNIVHAYLLGGPEPEYIDDVSTIVDGSMFL